MTLTFTQSSLSPRALAAALLLLTACGGGKGKGPSAAPRGPEQGKVQDTQGIGTVVEKHFDAEGRLLQKVTRSPGHEWSITDTYDAEGRLAERVSRYAGDKDDKTESFDANGQRMKLVVRKTEKIDAGIPDMGPGLTATLSFEEITEGQDAPLRDACELTYRNDKKQVIATISGCDLDPDRGHVTKLLWDDDGRLVHKASYEQGKLMGIESADYEKREVTTTSVSEAGREKVIGVKRYRATLAADEVMREGSFAFDKVNLAFHREIIHNPASGQDEEIEHTTTFGAESADTIASTVASRNLTTGETTTVPQVHKKVTMWPHAFAFWVAVKSGDNVMEYNRYGELVRVSLNFKNVSTLMECASDGPAGHVSRCENFLVANGVKSASSSITYEYSQGDAPQDLRASSAPRSPRGPRSIPDAALNPHAGSRHVFTGSR